MIGCLTAQTVFTDPVGFNKVTCLGNSDTIVGVPLRMNGSENSKLSASPVVSGSTATLTLLASNLPIWTGSTRYVKFNSGTKDGSWYDVTSNTANTLTINLNGDNLTGVVTGDSVLMAEYWTLDTLFPPAAATTDPATTGHAIVASTGTTLSARRSEILLPDIQGSGINLAVIDKMYIHGGIWKRSGDTSGANMGGNKLFPDNFFTIRHPATITTSTVFKSFGEVEVRNFTIPLNTLATGSQDIFVSIPRPIPVSLSQLNLWQSGPNSAFVASTGTGLSGRRDMLYVFDNTLAARNKAPSVTYYHNGTSWLKVGDGTVNHDADIIPAGVGIMIRKFRTVGGGSVDWKNLSPY
jgi:uncharacterized protein (TIGR02597 family)